MNKLRKSLLIYTLFLVLTQGRAQVQNAYYIGDTIYRYSANLEKDHRSFSTVRLQGLDFPCVDIYPVKESSNNGAGFQLFSTHFEEHFSIKGTTIYLNNYKANDPFLNINLQLYNFDNPIPQARSTHKDDFYNKVSNEIIFEYKRNDLNGEIRLWMDKSGFDKLRLYCRLDWKTEYKINDKFDNFFDLIEGYTVKNDLLYVAHKLEGFREESVESIQFKNDALLKDVFSPQEKSYLSFYDYRSLSELARIVLYPRHEFYINSLKKLGSFVQCNYEGEQIYLFPNPTFGDVKLKFINHKPGKYNFQIVNVIGKPKFQKDIFVNRNGQVISFEVSDLEKGIYLYKIVSPEGKIVQSKRLIIVNP